MTRPIHLFVSSTDGALYDTRDPNWSSKPPLRANYLRSHREIDSVADLKATLRAGETTDLGGYPLYFLASDCEALSFKAVRQELRNVMSALAQPAFVFNNWCVIGVEINYEDNDLFCTHTGIQIKSAY